MNAQIHRNDAALLRQLLHHADGEATHVIYDIAGPDGYRQLQQAIGNSEPGDLLSDIARSDSPAGAALREAGITPAEIAKARRRMATPDPHSRPGPTGVAEPLALAEYILDMPREFTINAPWTVRRSLKDAVDHALATARARLDSRGDSLPDVAHHIREVERKAITNSPPPPSKEQQTRCVAELVQMAFRSNKKQYQILAEAFVQHCATDNDEDAWSLAKAIVECHPATKGPLAEAIRQAYSAEAL